MAASEQPGAEPASGLRLPERYRARRHLASGGMASVWCAEDQMLGRTVAIKVLAERFADDEMAMRRFKREARAAARVSNHPHVVTIFDVGDLKPPDGEAAPAHPSPRPFIVMEYLAGGTVADAIRVGAVRRQEAVRWLREAASALDHAHQRGIVHRDIKPANFLLNQSRVLHVADFGIARLVSEDTISSAGELFGTAAYLSPEQALGLAATGASDRYALAVAAFELLAGERPFLAQHFAAQARQHIEDAPPHASTVDRTLPPAVDPVLIRGMAKQPEDRFETAGAFIDALETALSGGLPITAGAASPVRRRPAGRHTTAATRHTAAVSRHVPAVTRHVPAVARAGSAAAAGAAAAGAAWSRGREPSEPSVPTGPIGWTPADSIERGSFGRRGSGRVIALSALLVAIVVVATLAVAGLGGSGHRATTASTHARKPTTAADASARGASKSSARAATPNAASTTTADTTQAAADTDQNAQQLQLTGHQEMLDGNYQTAIATLKKAVSAAPQNSLTYAYGLYDLGRSMVLAGDPGGAVPILEQRLKIPNQTGVVQQELDVALQASGQAPAPTTTTQPAAPPASQPQSHHGHAHTSSSGGAGLTAAQGAPGVNSTGSGPGATENSNDVD